MTFIKNCYSSVSLLNNTGFGASMGSIDLNNASCSLTNLFYDNEKAPLSPTSGGNCSSGYPLGLNCYDLYNSILGNYTQRILWRGDNLGSGKKILHQIFFLDYLTYIFNQIF